MEKARDEPLFGVGYADIAALFGVYGIAPRGKLLRHVPLLLPLRRTRFFAHGNGHLLQNGVFVNIQFLRKAADVHVSLNGVFKARQQLYGGHQVLNTPVFVA